MWMPMKRILLLILAVFSPLLAMENQDALAQEFEKQCTIDNSSQNLDVHNSEFPSWLQKWHRKNEHEARGIQHKLAIGYLLAFQAQIHMKDIEEFHTRPYLIRKTFITHLDAENNLWCRVLIKKDNENSLYTDQCVKKYNQIDWDDIKDDVHHWIATRQLKNSKI